jgi:hypothetical protein
VTARSDTACAVLVRVTVDPDNVDGPPQAVGSVDDRRDRRRLIRFDRLRIIAQCEGERPRGASCDDVCDLCGRRALRVDEWLDVRAKDA